MLKYEIDPYNRNYKLRLYKFQYNSTKSKLNYKATFSINVNYNKPCILTSFGKFLTAHNNTLISQWNTTTFSHEKSYYLVYQSHENIIFNKDKTIMALYYVTSSKLVIYSLERNIIISSCKEGIYN
jgi:hypothetical protein